jgi:uncharacterized protein YgbK (DUF1537 family)
VLRRAGRLRFLAGCAGFAEILPDLLELPKRGLSFEKNGGSVLIVSGSVNPRTIDQISDGAKYGFSTFTLSLAQKLDPSYPDSDDCGVFVREVKKAIEARGRVIVRTVATRAEVPLTEARAKENGIPERELPRRIAGSIGAIAMRILREARVDCLAVFGGDTLHSVLSKMRCEGVCPLIELSPGVVVSKVLSKNPPSDHLSDRLSLSTNHSYIMITKSGGLGDRGVLGAIGDFAARAEDPGPAAGGLAVRRIREEPG